MTITRRFQFCAGHRVYQHESKCNNLHGHNYVLYVTVTASELDSLGRIIDFSVLKKELGDWIDNNWDHKFILSKDDKEGIEAVKKINGDENIFIMHSNPTAENMARHLFDVFISILYTKHSIKLVRITLHETENCYAEAH